MDRSRRLTLSVTEAAEVLGISRALAYELVARGELPSLQFGRRLVVPWRAIERLLASCEDTAPTEPPDAGVGRRFIDVDQPIPTIDRNPRPTTDRDYPRARRTSDRETVSEEPAPIANAHVPIPTHTLAPRVHRESLASQAPARRDRASQPEPLNGRREPTDRPRPTQRGEMPVHPGNQI
jgi:excisionase family DNA binding protein